MLVPLAAGLLIKARAGATAARLRLVLEKVPTTSMLGVVVLLLVIHFPDVLRIFGTGAILAAVVFAVLSALAGWLSGDKIAAERAVLGLGAGLRNVPAALIVNVQNFKDPRVSVMVIVSTLTGVLVLLPIARALGKKSS